MLALQMAMPAEDWTCDDSSRIRSKVQRCMQVHFHNLSFLVKNIQLTRGQALTSCLSCTARDLAPSPSELWSCRASWTSTWPSLHMRAKILPSLGHLITTTLCGRNSYNEQGMPGHLANFQPSNNQVPNHVFTHPFFFKKSSCIRRAGHGNLSLQLFPNQKVQSFTAWVHAWRQAEEETSPAIPAMPQNLAPLSSKIWKVNRAKSSPFKSRSSQLSDDPLHGWSQQSLATSSPNRPNTFNLLNKGARYNFKNKQGNLAFHPQAGIFSSNLPDNCTVWQWSH